jgi:hypothetical protein
VIETQNNLILNYGIAKREFVIDEISEELMSAAADVTEQKFRAILTDFKLDKVSVGLPLGSRLRWPILTMCFPSDQRGYLECEDDGTGSSD